MSITAYLAVLWIFVGSDSITRVKRPPCGLLLQTVQQLRSMFQYLVDFCSTVVLVPRFTSPINSCLHDTGMPPTCFPHTQPRSNQAPKTPTRLSRIHPFPLMQASHESAPLLAVPPLCLPTPLLPPPPSHCCFRPPLSGPPACRPALSV